MTDKSPPQDVRSASEDLAGSVAGVIDAALGVGVSLARVLAQATAPGKTIEPPPAATPPIEAIVRYGVTAAGNLASAVLAGAGELGKAGIGVVRKTTGTRASATAKAAAAGASAGPRVQAGATLRVPLSVENPGDKSMRGLSPRVRAVRRDGADAQSDLPADAVKFSPGLFDVGPRDFEKLTVLVNVPAAAPPGDYEITLALGPKEPDLPMAFAVVAPDAPAA